MDKTEPHFRRRQHILNCAIAVVAVYTQFVVLLMATSTERADWNEAETTAFVNYLWEHRAEGGDGGGFKDVTFRGASMHIASFLAAGPAKTPKHCKTKWTSVSYYSVNCPDTNLCCTYSSRRSFARSCHLKKIHPECIGITSTAQIYQAMHHRLHLTTMSIRQRYVSGS
jgi:hypothetical protein